MEVLQWLEEDMRLTERWAIADISQNGIWVVAHAHGGWARPGMLVGYRRPESLNWHISVVSRLVRSPKGKLSLGIQSLTGKVQSARVKFGERKPTDTWIAPDDGSKETHDAILLHTAQMPVLLLPPDVFSVAGEYMLSYERRWHKVWLKRILKRGYDYEEIEVGVPTGS
ncbi:MAG: hypothetical protein EXR36_01790 [Betaproteobacteria bacterium]|nr:hypothetical protein [Betaproteobacteria bacterium]